MKDIQKKNSLNKKSKSKKGITFHAVGMLAVSCCMAAPVMAESIVSETQAFVLAEQSHKVSGIVLDETGEPLIGVSVLIEGTSSGTITDGCSAKVYTCNLIRWLSDPKNTSR